MFALSTCRRHSFVTASLSNLIAFLCLLVGILVVCPSSASASDYTSHRLEGQTLIVQTTDGSVTLTPYNGDAIEVVYARTGVRQLPSYALGTTPQPTAVTLKDTPDSVIFSTPTLTATIQKRAFRISYTRLGRELLEEERGFFAEETLRGFRFKLRDGEKLMGGGQRVLGMNRRGQALPLDNHAAYGCADSVDAMYYGIPAVLSDRKYLLLFDNSARGLMDLGKAESDVMQFQAVAGRTAYVVFAGTRYSDIVENYVRVTGRQPMPPRWAFGNMASRFGYHNAEEARSVVRRFAADDIPLDAIIFDLYWFGPDIKGHMGNLAWDHTAFPDPERMIADFKRQGVNTILITEPFILKSSDRWREALENKALASNLAGRPKLFDFYFGTGGLVDMFDPGAAAWFWSKNKALLDQGVEGIWGDLGEPEVHPGDLIHAGSLTADEVHNAFGHQWAKTVYENWVRSYPDKRPFLMMRSGFAGSQRYGVIPWSGDVSRSWKALQAQIEIGLQMGMLGLAYSHSDLGGFVALDSTSKDPNAVVPFDKELYIRWLQFGAFQPVFRPHSQEQIASEPVFQDADAKDIVRRYIKLRYRLLPYLYTMAYRNSERGTALMRPLGFANDDPALFEDQSAFFWGDDMIVAPVTTKGATEKRVPLTSGVWFALGSDKRYGGGAVTVPVTIDDIPVFIKAGAFVPMIGDIRSTRDYSSKALTLHYYNDASITDAAGQMYEDDGKTPYARERGSFEMLNFAAKVTDRALRLTLGRERHQPYDGQPAARTVELVVHNWPKAPQAVTVDGVALAPLAPATLGSMAAGYRYSPATHVLTIHLAWGSDHAAIGIR